MYSDIRCTRTSYLRTAIVPSFPTELVDHILSYLDDDDDRTSLLSCSLASRTLHCIAQRYICRRVELGDGTPGQVLQRNLFVQNVVSLQKGSLVHHLIYDCPIPDLLLLIPHLNNLKSLTLLASETSGHGLTATCTLEPYPHPSIVALHDLISRPGFKSLDIGDYMFQGGWKDLEYLLSDTTGLKHLGLVNIRSFFYEPHIQTSVTYPPRQRAKPIYLESLKLGFPQVDPPGLVEGAFNHFILNWLADQIDEDRVVDITKLKKFSLINGSCYDVCETVSKFEGTLECLELEENELLDGTECNPLVAGGRRCVLLQPWLLSKRFPNLRHLGLSAFFKKGEEYRNRRKYSVIMWLDIMICSAIRFAPKLEATSSKSHADLQLFFEQAVTPLLYRTLPNMEDLQEGYSVNGLYEDMSQEKDDVMQMQPSHEEDEDEDEGDIDTANDEDNDNEEDDSFDNKATANQSTDSVGGLSLHMLG